MEKMPKIQPIRPDVEIERRVREALYGNETFDDDHPLGFWIGMRNAALMMLGFVGGGLLLARCF